jgi:hypothetical protein
VNSGILNLLNLNPSQMDPQQIMTRVKALASSLSPGQVRIAAWPHLSPVVVIVGGGAYWANRPSYALLYSDMDRMPPPAW